MIPVTKEGLEKMRQELQHLEAQVPVITKQISDAREKGDLKENAEYHAAREQLGHVQGNMSDLKSRLAQAVVVDCAQIKHDEISFGAIVELADSDGSVEEWRLVGQGEEDALDNRILTSSPMGAALLGHKKGDKIKVQAPVGVLEYKVKKIRYES